MHDQSTMSSTLFDLAMFDECKIIGDVVTDHGLRLIKNDNLATAVAAFAFHGVDHKGLPASAISLLMLDEGYSVAALDRTAAERLCALLAQAAADANAGRLTLRYVPALKTDALGNDTDATEPSSLGIERLETETGPVIGLWHETNDPVNQPGDELYAGGFSAIALDRIPDLVGQIRAQSLTA